MMIFPAHIRKNEDGTRLIQTVNEHSRAAAKLCEKALAPVGLEKTGYLLGLIHDCGKYTKAFADYISRVVEGETLRRGSVNHSFAPVQLILNKYRDKSSAMGCAAGELLAFALGSHHGLFDCVDPEGKDGFYRRLQTRDNGLEEALGNFYEYCADAEALDCLYGYAQAELSSFITLVYDKYMDREKFSFMLAMTARLLLSALVDADREDTARFMQGLPPTPPRENMKALWQKCLAFTEARIGMLPAKSPVQRARRHFSEQCRAFPYKASGIYSLSLPTGGGKTLSALRGALNLAANHGKKRIIFLTPLLSVLDQNAAVIREYIGDDSLILEHHSNIAEPGSLEQELLLESWDAPVIISTLVQFLNALFDGRNGCIRRMQSFCDSVIVLDEVQSVPRKLLSCFDMAVNFLAGFCNAAFILCSATQPCLEMAQRPMLPAIPIVPYSEELWKPFVRTEIKVMEGFYDRDALVALALEQQACDKSVLIICNKKQQARELFETLHGRGVAVYHMSTGMCMAHRMSCLDEIKAGLEAGQPLVCVSTQLVEAGVDFSFGCVIRLFAGLDNAVQAAGRCNRNGEFGEVRPVYLVRWKGEKLEHLREIREAQRAMENTVRRGFDSLQSDKAVSCYFSELYRQTPNGVQDCPYDRPFSTSLFELLSVNTQPCRKRCEAEMTALVLNQAFATAGECFEVFDEGQTDVIVPYGDGASLIDAMNSARGAHDLAYGRALLGQAKGFTVSLFSYQLKRLLDAGAVNITLGGAAYYLRSDCYSPLIGLDESGAGQSFLEV